MASSSLGRRSSKSDRKLHTAAVGFIRKLQRNLQNVLAHVTFQAFAAVQLRFDENFAAAAAAEEALQLGRVQFQAERNARVFLREAVLRELVGPAANVAVVVVIGVVFQTDLPRARRVRDEVSVHVHDLQVDRGLSADAGRLVVVPQRDVTARLLLEERLGRKRRFKVNGELRGEKTSFVVVKPAQRKE